MGKGIDRDQRIARETSDSTYSWEIDVNRKTKEFGIGDKVE